MFTPLRKLQQGRHRLNFRSLQIVTIVQRDEWPLEKLSVTGQAQEMVLCGRQDVIPSVSSSSVQNAALGSTDHCQIKSSLLWVKRSSLISAGLEFANLLGKQCSKEEGITTD